MIADCSHVGHIFRASNPIKWTHDVGPRNYVRVAMVWMDRYKGHYLERINYRVVGLALEVDVAMVHSSNEEERE